MKAHLDNQTKLHTGSVRKIVAWVLNELDVDRPELLVRVKKSRGINHHGRFYANARDRRVRLVRITDGREHVVQPQLPEGAQHLIMAYIPLVPTGLKHDRKLRGGPPPIDPKNWAEHLICITGHEGLHFRQFLFPAGKRRYSEVDAEWAEYRLLRRWREKGGR